MSEDQPISERGSEQEKIDQFWAAYRQRVHEKQRIEVAERIRTNPQPTEEELAIGAFAEEIEPQVRDAVFTFYRKGYCPSSSGFYFQGKFQQIDGLFIVDQQTKAKLETEGCEVNTRVFRRGFSTLFMKPSIPGITAIKFYPSKPDLEHDTDDQVLTQLIKKWNKVAEILPDRGKPAEASMSVGSVMFRQRYSKK